ncbi:MAG: pectate lyase [Alistipes sp.]|nr:pectate lyase [Alistipes sp.]
MKRFLIALLTLACGTAAAQQAPSITLMGDCIHHWYLEHEHGSCPRYKANDYRSIADNLLAYQNEDGGWPKNIDWLGIMDADSVINSLSPRYRESTFDNRNTYPQIIYLSEVYSLTGEKRYLKACKRGVEYMLRSQYPNGSWIGWHDNAICYNDDIITGILNMWQDVLNDAPQFSWINKKTRAQIKESYEKGLQLVLDTQYVQNGVKTVWAQQYDQQTLTPVKARTYELPGLSAGESAEVVLFLMSIENPSEEIIDAVKCAVAWYEKTKILGKKIVNIPMPEGNPEDPKIKADRRLVDDPNASPLWARFYELEDNTIFLCNRDGVKVYSLDKVWPERRVGYSWYVSEGNDVLRAYEKWLKRIEKR